MSTTWADIPREHRIGQNYNLNIVDEEKASKPFDNEQYLRIKSQRQSRVVESQMTWREGDRLIRRWWTAGHDVVIDDYVDSNGNRTSSAYGHVVGAGPTFIRVCWINDDNKVQTNTFFRTGHPLSC